MMSLPFPVPQSATLQKTGRQPSSSSLKKALPAAALINGETADELVVRAQAAASAKRLNEAEGICADVLAVVPDHSAATALNGIVAGMMGDLDGGIVLLRRAVQIYSGNAKWHAHLSALCRQTCRTEEALAAGRESIRLDPNNPEHLVNLSLAFTDCDDRDNAIICLIRALGLKHDYADGHLAMAQLLLAQGDFGPGWMEYEWRNLIEASQDSMPPMTSAHWNGMNIPKGRILLVGDQGYGDTIQFARFIPMVAERCQEVVVGCSAEMKPLLQNIPGVSQYCHIWAEIPGHAVHCRMSSLPYLFQTKLDTIPNRTPYLKADPSRVEHWRQRFDRDLPIGVKRIGIAWTGRPTHPNDRRRSIPLETLIGLADAGPATFVSLQKPLPARDQDVMSQFSGMTDISNELFDFGETAAVIENLDLVITVDTSMSHLAGALNKKVWILIPRAADWRWMFDRDDSPWYPSARLFRQTRLGEWAEPVTRLRQALALELLGN